MQSAPYIDLHTHPNRVEPETIIVQNIFPEGKIEEFTGRNFYSVGLHPWYIKTPDVNDALLSMVEDALEHDHVCFVGECGLDKLAKTDFWEQTRVFRAQAMIAEEFKRPLIIHCVRAYNEILDIHLKMKPEMPWIFHGYNAGLEVTQQLGKRGIFFSFGKSLFNPKSKSIESLRWLPMERIFFETDEFPGNVVKIYKQAALLKNVTPEMLKLEVWNNFNRVESSLISRF